MATISFRIEDDTKARLDRLNSLNASALFRQVLVRTLNDIEYGQDSAASLRLSLKDRLSLANQYEILAHLNPSEAERYRSYINVLQSGFEIQYGHLVQGYSGGLSDSECADVLRIMDMFNVFSSILRDRPEYKNLYDAAKFRGFNETLESSQYVFANYLIHDLKYYNELRLEAHRHGLSAPVPMMPQYRKMLEAWLELPNVYNPSPEEIDSVLVAGMET